MQYLEIIYAILALFFIFLILVIKKKKIFFYTSQKNYDSFFINANLFNNSLIVFKIKREIIIEKQTLPFDLFFKKFFFNKKTEKNFLTFIKNNEKFFYFFAKEKNKRVLFFAKNINKNIEKQENNYLLAEIFYFKNCINHFDGYDNNIKMPNNLEEIIKKTFFFIRIDLYTKEILKEHLILIKENIYSLINNNKIYIIPKISKKNKENKDEKISIYLVNLYNKKIKNIELLTEKIIKCIKEILKKLDVDNTFPFYIGILKNKKLVNWQLKIDNLMKFGFKRNIAIINEKIVNDIEQIKEKIIKNTFSFTNIINAKNKKIIGKIAKIYVNKKKINPFNLIEIGNFTNNNFLVIKKIFLNIVNKLKINSNLNKNNSIFLEEITWESIYNKEFFFNFLQEKICKKFNIKIFMCLKIENISKSQIIKKIDFINYLKKIKNDKIKFCFNINEDNIFLLNDDIFEIFDVIFIDYSANFFNIIKKILKYNKMIILKINDLNKIKKIIENNIVKYIIKT